jgi:hypothetical protein
MATIEASFPDSGNGPRVAGNFPGNAFMDSYDFNEPGARREHSLVPGSFDPRVRRVQTELLPGFLSFLRREPASPA